METYSPAISCSTEMPAGDGVEHGDKENYNVMVRRIDLEQGAPVDSII